MIRQSIWFCSCHVLSFLSGSCAVRDVVPLDNWGSMDVPVKDKKSWQLTTASSSLHGVGTGCQTLVAKNTLHFYRNLIGICDDLDWRFAWPDWGSEVISYKFVAIGGQGWWSSLGNSTRNVCIWIVWWTWWTLIGWKCLEFRIGTSHQTSTNQLKQSCWFP